MTRIGYREPPDMEPKARELTQARGNLNVYRTLANADEVFTGWMVAGNAALTSPTLPSRLRELVVLRTAYLMDCDYELGQHRDVARTAGLSAAEIDVVLSENSWQTYPFEESERAVLQVVSELLATRSVAPDSFERVHGALGSQATVELLMVIGRYAGLALMLNALDVDLDESARLPLPARRDSP